MVHKRASATALSLVLVIIAFLPTVAATGDDEAPSPAPGTPAASGCIPVSDAKDFTVQVCQGPPEECRVYVERTTKTGTTRACLVPVAASDASLECSDIASRHQIGPVTVLQHSSCSYTVVVAVNGDLDAAELLGIGADCPAYYKETTIGPATLVQGGCGAALILRVGPGALDGLVSIEGPSVVWEPWCIPVVPRLHDAEWYVCVDPDGPCYVREVRELPGSHQTYCAAHQPSFMGEDGPLDGNPALATKLFPEHGITVGTAPPCVGYNPSYWSDAGWTWCVRADGPCYVSETANTIAGPRERCVVGSGEDDMAASAPGKRCTPPLVAPDLWIEYCVYPTGPCVLGREGYSPSGDATRCYVKRPATGSPASGARCIRGSFEETVGPVTVIVPDTCTAIAHVGTEGGCLDRYENLDAGVVRYESTDTCDHDVRVDPRGLPA